ncbi:hypothetical protein Peur_014594 [Populus x canadensis]
MVSDMIITCHSYNNYSNYPSALFFYPIFASFVYSFLANHSSLLLIACGEEIPLHAFLHNAVLELKSKPLPPFIFYIYNNNNDNDNDNQLL